MRRPASRASAFRIRAILLAGFASLLLPAAALAYEQYSEDRDPTNCRGCHGDFRDSPYIALTDGQDWGDDLHDIHRNAMLDGDCSTCHGNGPFFPVLIGMSEGGDGLDPIACVGCHGRSEGGPPTATGLRQHHWRSGITDCEGCHSDSDPAAATPVGENVLPPYYANPGNNHPDLPTDSCNPSPGFPEDFAGSVQGLDNDGDLIYDEADADCSSSVCGNDILEPGEDCDDGNTMDGDCCSSTCMFEPPASPCDDGLFCTVGATCDGAGTCGGGMARDCDDGDICTDDSCNEAAQRCDNIFDPGNDISCQAMCPDVDADGFSPTGGGCGMIDCDDGDPDMNPAAAEVCDDDKDNDCNGFVDAADAACSYSGDWAVRPGPLQDDEFAGSETCAECHSSHFDRWRDSLHARILIRPGDAQATGFPLPPNDPANGVEVQSWTDVQFVVGQKWKTRWVDRNGYLQGTQWNYEFEQFVEYNNGQLREYDCGACHTTGYDPDASFVDDQGRTLDGIAGSWVEHNIGCEACHGAGAEHAASPSRANINRITFDWYDPGGDGTPDPVEIRSSMVCGNCHYRGDHDQIQSDRKHHEQYNDWIVSGHASSLEPTAVNTWCAKCHSPGNAEFFAAEHNFTNFEPGRATHAACISCHDPHGVSQSRFATLEFPPNGRQDPRELQATIARYRGSDDDRTTRDYDDFDNADTNALCQDCHKQVVGFRSHADASPEEEIVLEPPFAFGQPFVVPHAEHVAENYADCVDCHMHYSRSSINRSDVRTHTLLPNEWLTGSFALPHYDETCGQCHSEAPTCDWCHLSFGSIDDATPTDERAVTIRSIDPRTKRSPLRRTGRPTRDD